MNKKETLKKLQDFKVLLETWKKLDYHSPHRQLVRTEINKAKPLVQSVIYQAGTNKVFDIAPPPAVGGLIMRGVNPFDVIFDPPYGVSVISMIIDSIDEAIGVIESSENFTIELIPKRTITTKKLSKDSKRIFIVHGHDNELKETVARFIEKLELVPIILHEQASAGLTIIEKFEKYSDVKYSIVLMSEDDVGNSKNNKSDLNFRARQNVVFELGYFYGKLGRKNVCAIIKGNIERPSDNDGIIYVGIDNKDGWKILLGKELKEAGFEIDMNKIFK